MGLKSITIPESVTIIGDYAFWNCTSLTNGKIPASVTHIRQNAFQNCSSLREAYVYPVVPPESGTDIFQNCPALMAIYVPAEFVDAYKAAAGWKDYASLIQAMP